MDLNGRSANVDLTEPPRVVVPPTAPSSLPNAVQIQPPHFSMMMQQAVAMQQFQFQQALLMQQVMATQQAAARAANVKSATEMAAARAAEISKQLKGSDAEEEPATTSNPAAPSPNRSRSSSHSRSASRSKSHSPIRYRRDRSVSRSPIRYRRDRVSPLRSRDHYGYRSRSRRGYYRGGRGDYLYNPYRRDWDRDRDYYPRSRRSRSRSRSRVKRRSRTRSRSPWSRRERTLSPKNHREDHRNARNSRRVRSKEPRKSHSGTSRSHSGSPYKKEVIRSPRVVEGAASVLKEDTVREKEQSPTGCPKGNEETIDKVDLRGQNSCRDASESPIRSLSVSLSPVRKSPRIQDDNAQSTLKDETNHKDICFEQQFNDACRSAKEVNNKDSEGSLQEGNGSKVSLRLKVYKQDLSCRQGRGARRAEHSGKDADYESEDNKGVDDWRDDIKIYGREKVSRLESKDSAQKVDEPKVRYARDQSLSLIHNTMEPVSQQFEVVVDKLEAQEISPDYVAHEELRVQHDQYLPMNPILTGKNGSPGHLGLEGSEQEESTKGTGERTLSATPAPANEVEAEKDNEMEDQFVFEGPNPPFESYAATVELPEVPSPSDSCNALSVDDVKTKSTDSEADERKCQKGKHLKPVIYEAEDVEGVKLKGRSRSRESRRCKDVDAKKERHGKHKRKHHRGDAVFDEDEDEDEEEIDGHKERRRHRKKHKKDDDDAKKERKKKKHRHRKQPSSLSPRVSIDVAAAGAKDGLVSPVVRKRSSGRHRRRSRCSSKASHLSASSSD